jgi:bifunctional non-homologous end joining protein LigD
MSGRLTKVEFTNLEKVLYPELKVTKAQVIEHYIRVAPKILRVLFNRPLTLTRFPDGVDRGGFYEKDVPPGAPPWVETFKRYSESAQRELSYIVCNQLDTLIWMANLASLEIHMCLSTTDSFENPDLVLVDIDPEPPLDFSDVVDVAILVKENLDALGLRSYVKTSGKKGLHVVVPIVHGYSFLEAREFVQQIGRLVARESELVVTEFRKSRDPGTVFIDYLQNSHGRTMVCPYSLRATPNATVSTPLDWSEVDQRLKPEQFNVFTAAKIVKDPWKDLLEHHQKLEMNSK